MKKFIWVLVLSILAQQGIAQEKSPVQFVFSTERVNDSLVQLVVKTTINKGYQLFGVKKQTAEDEFVSALQLPDSLQHLLTQQVEENGSADRKSVV